MLEIDDKQLRLFHTDKRPDLTLEGKWLGRISISLEIKRALVNA